MAEFFMHMADGNLPNPTQLLGENLCERKLEKEKKRVKGFDVKINQ